MPYLWVDQNKAHNKGTLGGYRETCHNDVEM